MGKLVAFLVVLSLILIWLSGLPEQEESQRDTAPKWSQVQTVNPQKTVSGKELQGE